MNMERSLIRMMAATFILIRILRIMRSMYDDAPPSLNTHSLSPLSHYWYDDCLLLYYLLARSNQLYVSYVARRMKHWTTVILLANGTLACFSFV
jgi:hypothetical protein